VLPEVGDSHVGRYDRDSAWVGRFRLRVSACDGPLSFSILECKLGGMTLLDTVLYWLT
jgi:hypothetical protein